MPFIEGFTNHKDRMMFHSSQVSVRQLSFSRQHKPTATAFFVFGLLSLLLSPMTLAVPAYAAVPSNAPTIEEFIDVGKRTLTIGKSPSEAGRSLPNELRF